MIDITCYGDTHIMSMDAHESFQKRKCVQRRVRTDQSTQSGNKHARGFRIWSKKVLLDILWFCNSFNRN